MSWEFTNDPLIFNFYNIYIIALVYLDRMNEIQLKFKLNNFFFIKKNLVESENKYVIYISKINFVYVVQKIINLIKILFLSDSI